MFDHLKKFNLMRPVLYYKSLESTQNINIIFPRKNKIQKLFNSRISHPVIVKKYLIIFLDFHLTTTFYYNL